MKKKLIVLGALLVVLAGLVLTLVLLPPALEEQPAAEESGSEAIPVAHFHTPVRSITITPPDGQTYVLRQSARALDEYTGEDATLEGWEELPLYASKIQNTLNEAVSLSAIEVVSFDPGDLSPYGLNPAAATRVELEDYEGERVTLLLGKATAMGDGYYGKLDGADPVYHFSNTLAGYYLGGPETYLSTRVTAGSYAQFERVELGGTVREELGTVVIERIAGASGESTADYELTQPLRRALGTTDGVYAVNDLFGLQALDIAAVHPDDEQLIAYSLVEPYYATATVESAALDDFTLYASPADENGLVYVMLRDVPVVYLVSEDNLSWLDMQYYELMERLALPHSILDVQEVRVQAGGETTTFALTHLAAPREGALLSEEEAEAYQDEDNNLTVTVGVAELDPANFRRFYGTLLWANFSEYAEEQPPEESEPLLTVELVLRGGKTARAVFYEAEATRRCLLEAGADRAYYISSAYVDRVLADLPRVLADEIVQSYGG